MQLCSLKSPIKVLLRNLKEIKLLCTRKSTHLQSESVVLGAELGFHFLEFFQLVWQLEGGEDGIWRGQGDKRGRGQSPIGVNSRQREAQGVFLGGRQAWLAAALQVVWGGQRGAAIQQDLFEKGKEKAQELSLFAKLYARRFSLAFSIS